MLKLIVAIALIVFIPIAANALIVVSDSGNTLPISQFISDMKLPDKQQQESAIKVQINKIDSNLMKLSDYFKPEKSEFTRGYVKKHKIDGMDGAALFIIGRDDYSLKWVKINGAYLRKIHATGILVDAAAPDELNGMINYYQLPIIFASIKGLSVKLQTSHYPLLVYNNWVTQ